MDKDTRLLRHVHPSWVQNDRPSSRVFLPTAKDYSQLSVYDNSLISLDDSINHYQTILGNKSFGVLAVDVKECIDLDLEPRSDPEPFPEHVIIDFSNVGSKNQIKNKSKRLRDAALVRGWLAKT